MTQAQINNTLKSGWSDKCTKMTKAPLLSLYWKVVGTSGYGFTGLRAK